MKVHWTPRALSSLTGDVDQERTELHVLEGALPSALRGHYFVNTPCDRIDSKRPSVFLAGDGRIARVSFEDQGAFLSSRRVADSTMLAQLLASTWKPGVVLPFAGAGISCLSVDWPDLADAEAEAASMQLGARNFANTAVVPIVVDGISLLLATYDAGIPVVVHPTTLRVVGELQGEWTPSMFADTMFPVVNTSAHPAWDQERELLYSINFARDVPSILSAFLGDQLRRLDRPLEEVREQPGLVVPNQIAPPQPAFPTWEVLALYGRFDRSDSAHGVRGGVPYLPYAGEAGGEAPKAPRLAYWAEHDGVLFGARPSRRKGWASGEGPVDPDAAEKELPVEVIPTRMRDWTRLKEADASHRAGSLLDRLDRFAQARISEFATGFTKLMVWNYAAEDGEREPQVMELDVRDSKGEPIFIIDSVHQMGQTKELIVFADCRFKFDADLLITEMLDVLPGADARQIRLAMSRQLGQTTRLYVLKKSDVFDSSRAEPLKAHTFELPAEMVHFFVDHDDEGGTLLRLVGVHQRAFDGSEFVTRFDLAAGGKRVDDHVVGMFASPMDRQQMASYRIEITETPSPKVVQVDKPALDAGNAGWAVGIGTGPRVLTVADDEATDHGIDVTYWYDQGLMPELVTGHIYAMYHDYRGRSGSDRACALRSVEELRDAIRDGGEPGGLLRVRRSDEPHGIQVDRIDLPRGVVLLSPQWAPGPDGHPGYLVAPVFRAVDREPDTPLAPDQRERELWVFDLDGDWTMERRVCRLDADAAGWQYTIHTCWLDELPPADQKPPERMTFGTPAPSLANSGRSGPEQISAFLRFTQTLGKERRTRATPTPAEDESSEG